jgi:hypothetical protein
MISVDIVNPRGQTAMARKQAKGETMPAIEAEVKSIRLQLPLDVQTKFRVEAAKEGKSMAAVARRLVEEYLSKRKAGGR